MTNLLSSVSHEVRTPLNGIVVNINEGIKDKNNEASQNFKETYLKPA